MKSGDIIMGKNRKKDLLIFIVLLLITIVIVFYAMYLFYTSFKDGKETVINYNETSDLSYKVKLKENEFYADEFVGEDYNLIATAIDEIEINFDYLLNTSNFVKGSSYYTINSKIIAYQKDDPEERKVWDYEKIIKDKTITQYDKNTTNISAKDTFKIYYKEYKELMDNYKNKYAVSLVGNLIIDIEIKSDLTYEKFKNSINLESRKMTVTIPLTEQVVKITKITPEDASKSLVEKSDPKINYLKLVLSAFSFLGGVAMCIFLATLLVKLLGYDSKYERKLNKILKNYNSIIVSVEKIHLDKNQNIMNVSDFEELLDAQSELRVPILYCNIKPNKESLFYIKYDKDILIYKLKSDLYENDSKIKNKSDGYEEEKV